MKLVRPYHISMLSLTSIFNITEASTTPQELNPASTPRPSLPPTLQTTSPSAVDSNSPTLTPIMPSLSAPPHGPTNDKDDVAPPAMAPPKPKASHTKPRKLVAPAAEDEPEEDSGRKLRKAKGRR